MKLIRVLFGDREYYANFEEHTAELLDGSIATGFKSSGNVVSLNDLQLLPPVKPSKVLCVGLNYADHIKEIKLGNPTEPVLFFKPPSSIIGHDDDIILPKQSSRVDFEAELTVIIGKKAKNITKEDAADYIFGYTCANDVTARDLQRPDSQWTIAKGFDTFLPVGPYINTDVDPSNLSIITKLNGKVMQQSNTRMLIRDVYELVSYISGFMTLEPGDIVLTGTPAGIAPMNDGDVVSVEIENLGMLENNVVSAK